MTILSKKCKVGVLHVKNKVGADENAFTSKYRPEANA